MAQKCCRSFDDRQSKPQSLVTIALEIIELHEFLENEPVLFLWNSDACIEHLNFDPTPLRRQPIKMRP